MLSVVGKRRGLEPLPHASQGCHCTHSPQLLGVLGNVWMGSAGGGSLCQPSSSQSCFARGVGGCWQQSELVQDGAHPQHQSSSGDICATAPALCAVSSSLSQLRVRGCSRRLCLPVNSPRCREAGATCSRPIRSPRIYRLVEPLVWGL